MIASRGQGGLEAGDLGETGSIPAGVPLFPVSLNPFGGNERSRAMKVLIVVILTILGIAGSVCCIAAVQECFQ